MNVDFASHVRSASFHLTLSQTMIYAVLTIHRDSQREPFYGFLYERRTSNALYARGLIVPTSKPVPTDWQQSAAWPYCYELTQAGILVAGLLREAGFKIDDHEFPIGPQEAEPELHVEVRRKEQPK